MEILFRGKTEAGEWVEGDLVHNAFDGTSKVIEVGIMQDRCYPTEVIPKTVGQFTGQVDKNGKRLFKDDIISKKRKINPNNFLSKYWHDPNYFSVVTFLDGAFMTDDGCLLKEYIEDYSHNNVCEVIGNIHDNPELLK